METVDAAAALSSMFQGIALEHAQAAALPLWLRLPLASLMRHGALSLYHLHGSAVRSIARMGERLSRCDGLACGWRARKRATISEIVAPALLPSDGS